MTVLISKPSINLREALKKSPSGIAGEAVLRSDTEAEAREALSLDNHETLTVSTDGVIADFESTGIDDNATSTKLTVSNTGIDVTGTVTADGLTLAAGSEIASDGGLVLNIDSDSSSGSTYFEINADSTNRPVARFVENGDISFYEDTGTTPKFFWDASAEKARFGGTNDDFAGSIGLSGQTFTIESYLNNSLVINAKPNASNEGVILQYNGNDGFILNNSGNVGIGTSSPSYPLTVDTGAGTFSVRQKGSGSVTLASDSALTYFGSTHEFYDAAGTAEYARLDASGNLLVGKTSASSNNVGFEARSNGFAAVTRDDERPFLVNRQTSDGDIVEFAKDGTTVGAIGAFSGEAYFSGTTSGIKAYSSGFVPTTGDGTSSDDTKDWGAASARWDDIYATNATIQTSDANEKQDIEELSEAERRVAVACKSLLRKFRWISSVEEKGDDARIHFGIIAQDLQAAFEAEGLDAGRYAMFIHSTWTDEETGEERSRMGVRYSELLAFIIAAL